MLFGTYENKIDAKGRVAIPAKMRIDLGESVMVCPHILGKKCLCVYSMAEWEKFVAKLESFPVTKIGDAKRQLYSKTFNLGYDSQGRILLPSLLRDLVGLGKDAQFIGMKSYAEIWGTEAWEKEDESNSFDSMASAFEGLEF